MGRQNPWCSNDSVHGRFSIGLESLYLIYSSNKRIYASHTALPVAFSVMMCFSGVFSTSGILPFLGCWVWQPSMSINFINRRFVFSILSLDVLKVIQSFNLNQWFTQTLMTQSDWQSVSVSDESVSHDHDHDHHHDHVISAQASIFCKRARARGGWRSARQTTG